MSSKRTRKAAAPARLIDELDGSGSLAGDGGGGGGHGGTAASKRAGRANKKRDDRSALVEIWMCKNESGNKPSTDLKTLYANQLKIPKEEFWDTMKAYALKSKLSCVPDFEQIWHHMKDDKAELLSDLRVTGLDYWWEQEVDSKTGHVYYKPNTQNLKNFKPASGLLHHFYHTYIHDEYRYAEVRHNPKTLATSSRRGGKGGGGGGGGAINYRHDPEDLDDLVAKLSPFRILPEPKALLVLPNSEDEVHQSLRGTYALSKKVNGFNVFVRPARAVTHGKGMAFRSVVVNGTRVDVPAGKVENYAVEENGLALFCKEDKQNAEAAGDAEVFHEVPFRMRVPVLGAGGGGKAAASGGGSGGGGRGRGGGGGGGAAAAEQGHEMLEAIVDDLGESMFDLTQEMGVMAYPIRGLLPIPEIMRFIDFGAVWNGCFSPFPRMAASLQEFVAHFDAFPESALKFFFSVSAPGADVLADEYIRFMTWFANFDDGLGQGWCNARALHRALEGMPFSLVSQSDELRGRRVVGGFAVRLSDTKPQCLTVEVLQHVGEGGGNTGEEGDDEDDELGGNVLCFRLRVAFHHPTGAAAAKKAAAAAAGGGDGIVLPQVQFFLEEADGTTSVSSRNSLGAPILKKIIQQVGLPAGVGLTPLNVLTGASDGVIPKGLSKGSTGGSTTSRGSSSASSGGGGGGGRRGGGNRANQLMPPPPPPHAAAASASTNTNTHTQKRKRGVAEDVLPPPISKMGTAGASAFNDQTFDISGVKQLAASRVRRGVSNVVGGGGGGGGGGGDLPMGMSGVSTTSSTTGGGANGAPLTVWGQHIPMPTVDREHSLAPPPMMSGQSLGMGLSGLGRQESLGGKGDSWGSVMKNMEGLSPTMVGRDSSLGLGLSGFSRGMSIGSLPPLSREPSQESQGGGGGGTGEGGGGKGDSL